MQMKLISESEVKRLLEEAKINHETIKASFATFGEVSDNTFGTPFLRTSHNRVLECMIYIGQQISFMEFVEGYQSEHPVPIKFPVTPIHFYSGRFHDVVLVDYVVETKVPGVYQYFTGIECNFSYLQTEFGESDSTEPVLSHAGQMAYVKLKWTMHLLNCKTVESIHSKLGDLKNDDSNKN